MEKTTKFSDEYLMQQLSEGQLSSAAGLFDRYHKRLYNFFLRLTFNESLSEDLTQNVFERLIKYRRSYKLGMSFKSWIFQIARNVKTDHFKSKKVYFSDFASIEETGSSEQLVSKKLEEKEELEVLYQAIRRLKPAQQELLELTRFQKLKYSEVASLLNCSEGAVKVKVHRAIQELRKHYFKLEKQ